MKMRFFCRTLVLFLLFTFSTSAQEWTRFRGPNGTGISSAQTIPSQWSDKDFNWKVELPGTGHSSPVVWENEIYLTSTEEQPGAILVYRLDAGSGKMIWKKAFPFTPFQKHQNNSFASATPAVDAERVYVASSTPDRYLLRAFDHNGNVLWEQNLGPYVSQHSSGASPVLVGDKVFLANDQDGPSSLVAMDARTGEIRWKISRRTASNGVSYSTPCLYEPPRAKPQLIFLSWPNGVTAVDPDSGKVMWELANVFDKRCVSSPVIASGLIVGSCGSGGGGNYVAAVRPPENGKSAEVAYQIKRSAPYVPTSVAVGNLLFLWSDGGILSCVDAPTGQVRWQERVGGNFFGSPVCVDGRLFCVSTAGEVDVVEASDRFKILARNPLGEQCHTTPAVAGGKMYVRTLKHLYSIGGKANETVGR